MKVLSFLIRLPNKYLMGFIFLFIFAAYLYYQTEFLAQMTDKVLIAILTLLGVQKYNDSFQRKPETKPFELMTEKD